MLSRMPARSLQIVSVLVPTYLVKSSIDVLFESVNKNPSGYTCEIVGVVNESSDDTAGEVKCLSKNYVNTKFIDRLCTRSLGSDSTDWESELGNTGILGFTGAMFSPIFRRFKDF